MLPEAYNSNLQIHQGPGYVTILQEMIHDVRIIPLDGRPHLNPKIRQWMGDSRGHWEGNTLVVDTTNFTNRTNFRGSTENLHVVERFTRIDPDTIRYEFTVDDPATWTRPWTAELPLTKTAGPIFEYACHEGNFGMANTLSGARAAEKAADEAAAVAAETGNWKGFKTASLCTPEGAKLIGVHRQTLECREFLAALTRQPFRWKDQVFRILRCEYQSGIAQVEVMPDSPEFVAELKRRIAQDRFHVLPYYQGYGFISFPEDHQIYRD